MSSTHLKEILLLNQTWLPIPTAGSIVSTSTAMRLKLSSSVTQRLPFFAWSNGAGTFGDTIHRLYTTLQYVPFAKNEFHSAEEFHTVKIYIRDDTGNPVPFEFGKALVTLHCRPNRNKYFSS